MSDKTTFKFQVEFDISVDPDELESLLEDAKADSLDEVAITGKSDWEYDPAKSKAENLSGALAWGFKIILREDFSEDIENITVKAQIK